MNQQNLNSFNIVLPSNWVTNGLYPENRPSHYKTRLVEKIILTGDWEAAMSRISYPVNWENIRLSGTLSCQVNKEEPNESVDPINRFFGQRKPTFTGKDWKAPWKLKPDGTSAPKRYINQPNDPPERRTASHTKRRISFCGPDIFQPFTPSWNMSQMNLNKSLGVCRSSRSCVTISVSYTHLTLPTILRV